MHTGIVSRMQGQVYQGLQGKEGTESPCSLKDATGTHSAQTAMDSE